MSVFSMSTDKKHKSIVSIRWPFLHDIHIQSAECFWLVQVNIPLCARLCPYSFGMVCPVSNDDSAAAILDVFQMEIQYFPRA